VAVEHVLGGGAPQQLADACHVAAVDRVHDRAVDVAGAGVPGARPPVQLGLELRLDAAELGLQHARQHRVVAVRRVRVVERDQQDVGPRHVAQHLARSAAFEDGIAERAGQAVEHRRAPQEGALVVLQRAEQLVPDVVRHQAIVAREARDRPVHVPLAAERQRRQIEPCRPALGALEQHEHVLGRELEAGKLEHRGRLAAAHREVALAQVDEPSLRAQAADRQRRLRARGEDDLRPLRHRAGDRPQRLDGGRRAQAVDIVEDEDERSLGALERVVECRGAVVGGQA
jgi:hypothetical protein